MADKQKQGDLPDDDPTQVDPDDPSQQSTERDRVEQERKLSTPEEAEGGLAGTDQLQEEQQEGQAPTTQEKGGAVRQPQGEQQQDQEQKDK
jgi:hypothetical protein